MKNQDSDHPEKALKKFQSPGVPALTSPKSLAKKEENGNLPEKFSPNPPPAPREKSFVPTVEKSQKPPALSAQNVDVSDFIDFLNQRDLDTEKYWKLFEDGLVIRLSDSKPLTIEKISKALGSQFQQVREVDHGLIAVASLILEGLKRGLVEQNQFDLLLEQTKSWCINLNIPPNLVEKLDRGIEQFIHFQDIDDSLLFLLKQMNLMVLIRYPHFLDLILPIGLSPYVKEDYLIELLHNEVSIYSLLVIMKVFGITCLVVVEEGIGETVVISPRDRGLDKVISGLALYGEGEHFYIVEENKA